jgi:hypothetical protein
MHKRARLHLSELRSITMRTALVLVAYPGRCAQGPLRCARGSHHLVRPSTDGWSRIGMSICCSMPAGLPDMPNMIYLCFPSDGALRPSQHRSWTGRHAPAAAGAEGLLALDGATATATSPPDWCRPLPRV